MVKHNNQIPNIHCRKKYCASSRGPLKVRLSLDQATRKKSRRLARAKKVAAIAPAPLQKLRPLVHCPTQKYSAKIRLGRGFTIEELKAVKLHPKQAMNIGIAIDYRRHNHCEESLKLNVERLEEYKNRLVFLTKKNKELPARQVIGTIMPLPKPSKEIVMETITQEMKDFKAYTTMREARHETRISGLRIAVENRKKKE
jgi:large subunit ribosomal protein L13e